jgi:RimJ/RimL family protein N-acetyltransferase
MLELTPVQLAALAGWLPAERPGPLVASHVLVTGQGRAWADRWPAPRALLAETGGNYALAGDAAAFQPDDLAGLAGYIDAPAAFLPLLRAAHPGLVNWPRLIAALPAEADLAPEHFPLPAGASLRPLGPADEPALAGLSADLRWIANTWGGAAGLAGSGCAWGAFVAGRLASVAGSFFVGRAFEDIGVVSEPEFRGQGLSPACAAAVCRAVRARGRTPSWSTSSDNGASQRVAEKLGFARQRTDWLYVTAGEEL